MTAIVTISIIGGGLLVYLLFVLSPNRREKSYDPVAPSPPFGPRADVVANMRPGASANSEVASGQPSSAAVAEKVRSRSPETEQAALRILDRTWVREHARAYRKGRFELFSNEDALLVDLERTPSKNVALLREELADTSSLYGLGEDVRFSEDRPDVVLDRMAMIDLLKVLATRNHRDALDAMVSLLLGPSEGDDDVSVKRALFGERFDLLFDLAQLDQALAVDVHARIGNDRLRELLRPALVSGLSESGMMWSEIERLAGRGPSASPIAHPPSPPSFSAPSKG